MTVDEIIKYFEDHKDEEYAKGAERFGILGGKILGVRHPEIKKLAKKIKKDHELALKLMDHELHEARLLAPLIAVPEMLSWDEADEWVKHFYSWDLVDNASGLFARTYFAHEIALQWCENEEEFIRRTGLVTLVAITVHDKKANDEYIESFLQVAEKYAFDDRNFVKKAVNWLIRQIGKRNLYLNEKAIEVAERMSYLPLKSAKWIAKDALRELKSEKVKERLISKEEKLKM